MAKHPVSLKRQKRKTIGWLIVDAILLVVALTHCLSSCCEAVSEKRNNTLAVEQDITPTPEPIIFTETPDTGWTPYEVPLTPDFQEYIHGLCEEHGVSMSLVVAIIAVESNYDEKLIGDNGNSYGLMQIYKVYHEDRMERLGVFDLLDPYQNVAVGIDLLAELYEGGHSTEWVLMAYNGGASYAGEMYAQGNISAYAQKVLTLAEQLEPAI